MTINITPTQCVYWPAQHKLIKLTLQHNSKRQKIQKDKKKREKQNINKAKHWFILRPANQRERESSFGQGPGGQPIRERERESYWDNIIINKPLDHRERERDNIFFFHTFRETEKEKERKREKIPGGLATAMSTGDSDGDCEGRGGKLSTGDPDDDCEGRGRGNKLSRSICDERRDCDLLSLWWAASYGEIGFLIFSVLVQSLYWGFFFFFGTESVLSLVYCFCFFFWYVLILLWL